VYHSAAATKPAKKFHIFHQWHLGKSADFSERTSPTKDSMIAASHSEQNACIMRKTVCQSIHGVWRQANPEKTAGNAWFSQYALDFSQAFLRHFHVRVQKPKDVAGCGTCAEVQLRSPIGLTHHELIAKACCEGSGSITASAICHNDFSFRRALAQLLQKRTYQRCLVVNRDDDGELHLNALFSFGAIRLLAKRPSLFFKINAENYRRTNGEVIKAETTFSFRRTGA
jgi:hypothetical protein